MQNMVYMFLGIFVFQFELFKACYMGYCHPCDGGLIICTQLIVPSALPTTIGCGCIK